MSDIQASKYRCCWDLLHVKTGTKIICTLVLFGCFLSIVILIRQRENQYSYMDYIEIGSFVVQTFAFSLVLFGIKKSKAHYFRPCLYLIGFEMAIFAFIFWGYLTLTPNIEVFEDSFTYINYRKMMIDHTVLWSIIGMLVNIFCFDIIYKCFKYVKDNCCKISSLPLSTISPGPVQLENKLPL